MFATIRRYTLATGAARQLASRTETEFLPRLRTIPGFIGYELIIGPTEEGRDTLVTVSTFTARNGVEESGRVAAQWVAERLQDFDVQAVGTTTGEVLVSTQLVGATQ